MPSTKTKRKANYNKRPCKRSKSKTADEINRGVGPGESLKHGRYKVIITLPKDGNNK